MAIPDQPGAIGNAPKLIEKLAIGGQLRAGFLLRALQMGETELFDLAFAMLLDLDLEAFRRVYYTKDAHRAALACRAVGIDRCAFPTVYGLSARDGASCFPENAIEIAFCLPRPEARALLHSFA